MKEEQTVIFCDGSSLGNPGPGGWGVIAIRIGERGEGKSVKEIGGGEAYTTNNRMELTAAINALAKITIGESAILYTDSTYVVNGMTKWRHGWEKNGWRTANKKPVENMGLWQELISLTNEKKVAWRHISAHIGIAGNERADEIARSFAEGKMVQNEYTPSLYAGNFSEYPRQNILDLSHNAAKKTARGKARERRKIG